LAKIAVKNETVHRSIVSRDPQEHLLKRPLAAGDGWSVCAVVCDAGPHVRPFEEQHCGFCIAIVRSGSFQYRSSAGCELMTPGSLMLGNPGQSFECRHEHAVGDRCLSFTYQPRFMDELLTETAVPVRHSDLFSTVRVPVVRELSGVIARASAAAQRQPSVADGLQGQIWEEIAVELAVRALEGARGISNSRQSPAAEARVTRVIRMIENFPTEQHSLADLAKEAKLSRYHFVRIFQQLTRLTPHQYVRRARLRRAATLLLLQPARILDVALDSGFGDVSNFNHAFIAEFAVSPRTFRARRGRLRNF
jgi:AraC family transcriptional regulator